MLVALISLCLSKKSPIIWALERIKENYKEGELLTLHFDIDRLNLLIEFLQSSEWVSVEERLPEKDSTILCYFKNGRIDVCKYCKVFEMEFVENAVCVTEQITHWMPLPTPPNR